MCLPKATGATLLPVTVMLCGNLFPPFILVTWILNLQLCIQFFKQGLSYKIFSESPFNNLLFKSFLDNTVDSRFSGVFKKH